MSTLAGGRRAVVILGAWPPSSDFSFSFALSSAVAAAGGAATFPHDLHPMHCECQRWYVPSRTQSSSTVRLHLTHKSLGGFTTGTLLSPGSREAPRNGDSPAFSGARLRKPYMTPLVPALPEAERWVEMISPLAPFNIRRADGFPPWTASKWSLSRKDCIASRTPYSRSSLSAPVRAMRMRIL